MSQETPYRNPGAALAVLITMLALLCGLGLLAVQHGIAVGRFFYHFSPIGVPFLLASIVIGPAFILYARGQTGGRRDWRIPLSLLFLTLSVTTVVLFFMST